MLMNQGRKKYSLYRLGRSLIMVAVTILPMFCTAVSFGNTTAVSMSNAIPDTTIRGRIIRRGTTTTIQSATTTTLAKKTIVTTTTLQATTTSLIEPTTTLSPAVYVTTSTIAGGITTSIAKTTTTTSSSTSSSSSSSSTSSTSSTSASSSSTSSTAKATTTSSSSTSSTVKASSTSTSSTSSTSSTAKATTTSLKPSTTTSTVSSSTSTSTVVTTTSISITTTTIAPSPAASRVTLAWDAVTDTDLAGYKIYYGTASGTYTGNRDAAKLTTYTFLGLPNGTHYFAVKAYNTSGVESGFSNEVSTQVTASTTTASVSVGQSIAAKESGTIPASSTTAQTTSATTAAIDIQSGLVAAYGFDEGAGATAGDSSGNQRTGQLNRVNWTATAVSGNALSFDGKKSYISIPAAGLPSNGASQTLSFWIYLNSRATNTQSVLSLINEADQVLTQVGYKNSLMGVWQRGGSWLTIAVQPVPQAWRFIAYTYDGRTHRFYIDGKEVSNSTIAPKTAQVLSCEIGRAGRVGEYYKGMLDELRMYNRALSPSEIEALMTATGATRDR